MRRRGVASSLVLAVVVAAANSAAADDDPPHDAVPLAAGAAVELSVLGSLFAAAVLPEGDPPPWVGPVGGVVILALPLAVALTERHFAQRGDAARVIGGAYLGYAIAAAIFTVVFGATLLCECRFLDPEDGYGVPVLVAAGSLLAIGPVLGAFLALPPRDTATERNARSTGAVARLAW